MKKEWSKNWIGSKQPRKQRKYRKNAPLHIRQKFVNVHLSKELREKYETRSVPVRVGDKVEIVTGKHRKKSGKVDRVDLKKSKVFVSKIERIKKEGTKTMIPLEPSNLMIIELNADDKRRFGSGKKSDSKSDNKSEKKSEKKTDKPKEEKPVKSESVKKEEKPEVKTDTQKTEKKSDKPTEQAKKAEEKV